MFDLIMICCEDVYHGEVKAGRVSISTQLDYASALVRSRDKVR